MLLWFLFSLIITCLDQFTKHLVSIHLQLGEMVPVIPGVLTLTHVRNTGAAFGILSNQTALLAAISSGVIGATLVYRQQFMTAPIIVRIGIFLALGGALGNLIDRIRLRAVVDFVYVTYFPVFNVADMAICTGVGLIALAVLLDGRHPKGTGPSPDSRV